MIHAEILRLASNDHIDWSDFAAYEPIDPFDDFGWFHVTVGATGIEGGNDFQVCVSTHRAVGRVRRAGAVPGVIVDCFDAESVDTAIRDRIASIAADSWDQIVNECRTFMLWEYEKHH